MTSISKTAARAAGLVFLAVLLCAAGAAPAAAQSAPDEEGAGYVASYTPVITGVDDDLRNLLASVSDTFVLQDRPPASRGLLRVRVEGDAAPMKQALRSKGYFQAEVQAEIGAPRADETPPRPRRYDDRSLLLPSFEADPLRTVTFRVSPGPRFTLTEASLDPDADPPPAGLPSIEETGLTTGRPYDAEDVIAAMEKLSRILGRKGYPFAAVKTPRLTADHADHSIKVVIPVDAGRRADFGPTTVEGLKDVDEDFVRRLFDWQKGQVYNADKLTAARTALLQTGLFSVVTLEPGEVNEEGRTPIRASFKERAFRTVRAGIAYQTDTEFELRLSWEHRNYLGGGERLDASLRLNKLRQVLETGFRKPAFLTENQMLLLSASAANEDSDAFQSRSIQASAGLEWSLTPEMSVGAGVRYKYLQVLDEDKVFGLLSFPAYMNFDYSNNLLNPTAGGRLNMFFAPYTDTLGNTTDFQKTRAAYRHYFSLFDDWLVLAGRVSAGVISSTRLEQIPAEERFYSGGGGSVRGYAYQKAGQLDEGDEPIGGLSLLETSAEARFKVSGKIGGAVFVDAGRAFRERSPDDPGNLFWGAGAGVRYYTGIGPVRLDVAVPLDRREDVDAPYQVYVSLGQAY